MTEAVILALIALVGMMIFSTSSIILVEIVLKKSPTKLKFYTAYGKFEVGFNTRADG